MLISQCFSLISFVYSDNDQNSSFKYWNQTQGIISDEIRVMSLETEQIISDEVALLSAPEENISIIKDLSSLQSESWKLVEKSSDNDVLQIFITNKSRFMNVTTQSYDYDDFMKAWKTLSTDYNKKEEEEILTQKQHFLEVYLHLKWGYKK